MKRVSITQEQLETLPVERLKAIQGLLTGWLNSTEPIAIPISADTAQIVVNDWLTQVLPDRFLASEPTLIAGGDIWSVPVGLAYPSIGIIGTVGEVLVSAFSEGIISATQPEAMKSVGIQIYTEKMQNGTNVALSAQLSL